MLCHVFCGGAGVDKFVQCGCNDTNGVPAISCSLQIQGGSSITAGGRHHLCLCNSDSVELELDSFYRVYLVSYCFFFQIGLRARKDGFSFIGVLDFKDVEKV